jgi:DNA-binding MarR family transcriptional regulator
MTDLAEQTAAERPYVAAVADQFVTLMRSFIKARNRMLAAAAHDVEWAAHMVLKCVETEGPIRAGAIAEWLHSDPSTVSRQVAALVKDGLLERRADPADGRASLLALTDRADAVLAEHNRIRLDHFATMLDDWSDADLRRFATLLQRFTADYESAQKNWLNDRAGRTGSTN